MTILRSKVIRLASDLPTGSPERRELLAVLKIAGRDYQVSNDIKLKDGSVIPAGSSVSLQWGRYPDYSLATLTAPGRPPVKLNTGRLHNYLRGFPKPPGYRALEKMMENGVALTPTGKRVEPDGVGPDGSPSWLLIGGLI